MSDAALSYELDGAVALIRLDDGKANALSPERVAVLGDLVTRAEKEAAALVIAGRDRMFCAGFDLATMREGGEATRALVTAGAELLARLYVSPIPTVAACTGHGLAAGALMLLACDVRVGARGDFKLGLNEVAIGMPLPIFAVTFARERLSKRHLTRATILAEIYDPEGAVDAGYLDQLTDPASVVDQAMAEARRLAEMPTEAIGATKRTAREAAARHILDTLADDMAGLTGPDPS